MNSAKRPSWLSSFIRKYAREVAEALGLGLVASGCAALLMFTSGYLISATALAGVTLFSIMIPVAFVQLFGFGRPAARYVERLVSHDWVLRVTSDLRVKLYDAVASRTGDPAREQAMGEYLGLLADDVAHLQNLYLRVVFPTAIAYALALGAAILFGFFSLPFALVIALSFAVTAVGIPLACRLAARALIERGRAAKAEEYVSLTDDLFGSVDWALSGRGEEARARHARSDASIRAAEAKVRMTQRAFTLASTVLMGLLLCGVVVWAGHRFGDPGANVNWIAAFALGFFPLIESFSALPAAVSESVVHRMSVDRLDEYLDSEESGRSEPERPAFDATHSQAIEFEDVRYTYPGSSHPTLDGLSLAVSRGQSVAVLGRSGAGKSTFAKVACGVLPADNGKVSVLGAEIERRDVDLSGVVGFLGQTPYLFNRSLRENLTMGAREIPDGRLLEALRAAGLEAKLESLPRGLDTVVGETGVGFSGGEAHRVALARVLVADTPIVIVDEPFSALDPETERDLLSTMLEALADRTLVVITHHLAQVERFDRVVFIENGVVDLDGSPQQLMAESDRFRTLVEFDR